MLCRWWVRWLALVSMLLVITTPLWILLAPYGTHNTFLPTSQAVQALASSLILATAMTAVTQPQHRLIVAALDGLDSTQRRQAVRAMADGEVPTDPAVLSGALRLATFTVGIRNRTPRWIRRVQPVLPVLFLVLAIPGFARHDHRMGLPYLVMAVLVAAAQWRESRIARRMQARLAELRTAAEHVPGAALLVADEPPVPSTHRALLIAAAVTIAVVAVAAGVTLFDRAQSGCQAADDAITIILTDHRNLIDTRSRTGEPALSEYRDWAQKLHDTALRAAGTDVGEHLQRIAEYANGIAVLVGATPDSEGERLNHAEPTYFDLVKSLLDEVGAIQDIC